MITQVNVTYRRHTLTDFVRRGASVPSTLNAEHQVGKIVTYKGFTSTSLGNGFNNVSKFIIKSLNCAWIAPLSYYPLENEVLCKSDTQFRILYIDSSVNYLMEEVPDEELYFDN